MTQSELFKQYSDQNNLYLNLTNNMFWFEFGGNKIGRIPPAGVITEFPIPTPDSGPRALAAGPDRWTAMEGGVPIMVNGECIGGCGVSGGDWQTDLRIAQAAVESIGASWK
mgnify:CR=1 FL=1